MDIPVFRNGKIYYYSRADISWSQDSIFEASSFYATCIEFGYDDNKSNTLSAIYINSKIHPEMSYEKEHMNLIDKIFNKIETSLSETT